MPIIIGIVGEAKTGKSTIANFLVSEHKFTEFTFAEPIKQIAEIFFYTKEQLYHSQEAKVVPHPFWGDSARDFMQKVGTELFRNHFDPSVWLRHLQYRLKNTTCDRIVITDVRYANEADLVKEMGGILVKCTRTTDVDEKHRKHSSESGVRELPYDYLIDNDTLTIEEAYALMGTVITDCVV